MNTKSSRGSTYHSKLGLCPLMAQGSIHSEGQTPEQASGSALHALVEEYLRSGVAPAETWDALVEARKLEPLLLSVSRSDVLKGTEHFIREIEAYRSEGGCTFPPEWLEREVTYQLELDVFYSSRVDALRIAGNGKAYIVDWKTTGSASPNPLTYRFTMQHLGFWHLGDRNIPNFTGVEYWVYSWSKRTLQVFSFERPSIDFEATVRALDARRGSPVATPGFHCLSCVQNINCWSCSK